MDTSSCNLQVPSYIDVAPTEPELEVLRSRWENAVSHLRDTNEQLRELIDTGDRDPEYISALVPSDCTCMW